MGRRIVVLFDGTWNNRKDRTNVVRMRESVETSGPGDPVQPCFYDPGVGTHWYDRLTGGAFGQGLSENIRQGYAWLAEKHVPEDQVFVFGFSRGAYTARSLVGFIRKCGLLNSPRKALVAEAYELYRDKSVAPDDSRPSSSARSTRARFACDSSGCGTPSARWAFRCRTCRSAATITAGTTRISRKSSNTPTTL